MNYKYPFFILITGMVVASILPFGMSQVQEDAFMEIDMLQTQVENPFRIQDYTDTDVFSIDMNGIITPDQDGWTSLHYSSVAGEIVNLNNVLEASPFIAKEYFITYNYPTDTGTEIIFRGDNPIITNFKRLSGAGFCTFELQTLESGTWGVWLRVQTASAVWTSGNVDTNSNIEQDIDGVRFVYYTEASTVCQFRNTSGTYEILHLPDVTITRGV